MKKIIFIALAGLALLVTACSTTTSTSSTSSVSATSTSGWSAKQRAHVTYVAVTAAINTAAKVKTTSGLSDAVKADIVTASTALANSTESGITTLLAGGDLTAEAKSILLSALSSSVSNLGDLLTAAHGSSVDATDTAIAAGLDALQGLPSVISAVVLVNSGIEPSDDVLAADLKALKAAATSVRAA